MQTSAIKAFCPERLSIEIVTPIIAIKYSQIVIPMAPSNNNLLLPNLSTPHIPGKVINTLTMFVAMVIKNGFRIPEFLKNAVP